MIVEGDGREEGMDKWSLFGKLGRVVSSFFTEKSGPDTVLVVKTAYAADGRHRVCFFLREEDGVCGFREEIFDDKLLEMSWRPINNESAGEYPGLAAALAAAKAEIPWLRLVL